MTSLAGNMETQRSSLNALTRVTRETSRVTIALRKSSPGHLTLDSLPANLAVLDQQGVILFVNAAWRNFTTQPGAVSGHRPDVGANYLEMTELASGGHFEEARQASKGIQAVMAGRQREFSFIYSVHLPGQPRWFLMQATPLKDPEAGAVLVSHVEITAQKIAGDLLRESEARYRRLFETASDGLLLVDAHTGEVLDANFHALDFLGCDRPLPQGGKLWEISGLKSVVPDQAALRNLAAREVARMEYLTVPDRNGEPRHIEMVSTVCPVELKWLLKINLRDVTARKQAEQALADSQLHLEQTIHASRAGPWEWDLAANRIQYSQEWKKQLGLEQEALSDQLSEWESRLHPEDQDRVLAELRDCLTSLTGSLDFEFRLQHKDETYRWMNVRGQLFRDAHGQPRRVLGCQMDITERKSLEDQFRHAQKLDSLGQLAGGVAHDFNNLLTIILGYSEMLLDKSTLEASVRDSLKEIKGAGVRAAALTRQLLAFSRKQVLAPASLDLNEVVCDCEKMLKRLLGEEVVLINRLAPSLDPVRADIGQLEQVLVNLAVNARDAMPEGGTLTIETAAVYLDEAAVLICPGLKPGNHVRLTVTDTGEGMDAATQARIFEPFFTTKKQGKGTGLGLAMIFGFIKQSGGHVSVSSEPGKGATFQIYLPCIETPVMPEPTAQAGPAISFGWETILLVEDEDAVRTLAQQILQNLGYTVLSAARGAEALMLAQTRNGPIHLLITDVVMPGLDGRHLSEAVTRLRPGTKTLFISGHADDTVLRHGIPTTGATFLQKPFDLEALPGKVRKVLDQE